MTIRRIVLTALFALLTVYAVLTVNRIVHPALTQELLIAVALGLAAGLPGMIDRRLALLTPVLVPAGLYALFRLTSPLPEEISGAAAQYSYYVQELRLGFSAYREAVFPLPLTGAPGLGLLVTFWVYLLVAGASILALGGNRVFAGATVLFALLAFTLTVDDSDQNLLIASGFLLILVLLLVAGEAQHRCSWSLADLAAGLLLGVLALGLATAALQTSPGIAAGGWQDWRTWRPFGDADREIVFNWRQNYPRLLDPQNEFPVMRVASPTPSYWRANTLEVFTGDAWLSAGSFYTLLEPGEDGRLTVPAAIVPPGREVTQRFLLEGISTTYLFVGGEPLSLTEQSGGGVYTSGFGSLRTEIPLQPPSGYEVKAVVPRVTPQQLMRRGRDYPEPIAEQYLALPLPSAHRIAQMRAAGEDWRRAVAESGPRSDEFLPIYDLNERVVRGTDDPYQIALRLERFLRNRYDYSLQIPYSRLVSPYAAFLFDTRVGYCQQFAGAMALLLRLNGVPARVAVGFTTGERLGDGSYLVRTNNAHAWVEAYFPGIGWVPFDPTPGRNLPLPGGSSTSPGFEDPYPLEPVPSVEDPAGGTRLELPAGVGADPGLSSAPGEGNPTARSAFPYAALALPSALIGWPLLRRRRRLRPARRGSPGGRLSGSLALLERYLRETGYPIGPSSTPDEIATLLERDLKLEAAMVRLRAQEVIYGGAPPALADIRALERIRHHAEKRIRQRKGRLWTVLSWYGGPRLAGRITGRLSGLLEDDESEERKL